LGSDRRGGTGQPDLEGPGLEDLRAAIVRKIEGRSAGATRGEAPRADPMIAGAAESVSRAALWNIASRHRRCQKST